MRFSVVIPVYNVASYLTGCVNSVLSNQESDYEIILVDDGSTDERSGPLCDVLAAKAPTGSMSFIKRIAAWVELATPAWKQHRGSIYFFWTETIPSPLMPCPF